MRNLATISRRLAICTASIAFWLTGCTSGRAPISNNGLADTILWMESKPSRDVVVARLGSPRWTGGSGLEIWILTLDQEHGLSMEWLPGVDVLAYASIFAEADKSIVWEKRYDLTDR